MIELDRIYNEDCLEGMKRIPDGSVDCVICDLPYGMTNAQWDKEIPSDLLWKEYRRVCKPNAAVVLFGIEPFSSRLRVSNIKAYKYDWIWYKNAISGFLNAKKQPLRDYETISVFYSKQCTYNPQMVKLAKKQHQSHLPIHCTTLYGEHTKGITKDVEYHYPRSVIRCQTVNSAFAQKKTLHPTQKPLDLIRYLVRTYTNKDETVLDNCMGSGTTAVACIKERRHFIGFETDKGYFDIANKRIDEARKALSLFPTSATT